MSRPTKAVVDYFPHFIGHGKTMFTLESKFGNDGYTFWFKLLELLGASEQHFIDCNNTETWEYLLAKTRVNEQIATEILILLSKLGAIDNELWTYKIIRSDNFINNLSSVYKRRGVKVLTNSEVLDLCKQKPHSNEVIANNNPQSKVKESKVKESNNIGQKFTPPTLEEVKAYCQERNNGVDPEKWHDFYSSKGWMIGKNKMKDWRAAVRTWENNDPKNKGKPNKQYRDEWGID